jgi:hypothetical protein
VEWSLTYPRWYGKKKILRSLTQILNRKTRRYPMTDKRADLAGPGIGNYDDLEKNLPKDYEPLIPSKERMKAIHAIKSKWFRFP